MVGLASGLLTGGGINVAIRAIDDFTKPMEKISRQSGKMERTMSKMGMTSTASFLGLSAAVGVSIMALSVMTSKIEENMKKTKEWTEATSRFNSLLDTGTRPIAQGLADTINYLSKEYEEIIIKYSASSVAAEQMDKIMKDNNLTYDEKKAKIKEIQIEMSNEANQLIEVKNRTVEFNEETRKIGQYMGTLQSLITVAKDELELYGAELNRINSIKFEGVSEASFTMARASQQEIAAKQQILELEKQIRQETGWSKDKVSEMLDYYKEEGSIGNAKVNNLMQQIGIQNQIIDNAQSTKEEEQLTIDAANAKLDEGKAKLDMYVDSNQGVWKSQSDYNKEVEKVGPAWAKAKVEVDDLAIKYMREKLNKEMRENIKDLDIYQSKWKEIKTLIESIKLPQPTMIGGGGGTFAGGVSKGGGKKDFLMRPGQEAVNFSPDDTIIGVKNPEKIGGGGVTVNIGNIYGIDARQMAEELQRELNKLLTT